MNIINFIASTCLLIKSKENYFHSYFYGQFIMNTESLVMCCPSAKNKNSFKKFAIFIKSFQEVFKLFFVHFDLFYVIRVAKIDIVGKIFEVLEFLWS